MMACSDDSRSGNANPENIDDSESTFDTSSLELNGTWPDNPIAAPEFTALNFDNTGRDQSDLIGNPSVLWFYPAAGTFG